MDSKENHTGYEEGIISDTGDENMNSVSSAANLKKRSRVTESYEEHDIEGVDMEGEVTITRKRGSKPLNSVENFQPLHKLAPPLQHARGRSQMDNGDEDDMSDGEELSESMEEPESSRSMTSNASSHHSTQHALQSVHLSAHSSPTHSKTSIYDETRSQKDDKEEEDDESPRENEVLRGQGWDSNNPFDQKEIKRLESNSAKKVKERARRGKMSDSVKSLRSLVPYSFDEKKVNQAQVMANSVAYITKLQTQIHNLTTENIKLKHQVTQLNKKLGNSTNSKTSPLLPHTPTTTSTKSFHRSNNTSAHTLNNLAAPGQDEVQVKATRRKAVRTTRNSQLTHSPPSQTPTTPPHTFNGMSGIGFEGEKASLGGVGVHENATGVLSQSLGGNSLLLRLNQSRIREAQAMEQLDGDVNSHSGEVEQPSGEEVMWPSFDVLRAPDAPVPTIGPKFDIVDEATFAKGLSLMRKTSGQLMSVQTRFSSDPISHPGYNPELTGYDATIPPVGSPFKSLSSLQGTLAGLQGTEAEYWNQNQPSQNQNLNSNGVEHSNTGYQDMDINSETMFDIEEVSKSWVLFSKSEMQYSHANHSHGPDELCPIMMAHASSSHHGSNTAHHGNQNRPAESMPISIQPRHQHHRTMRNNNDMESRNVMETGNDMETPYYTDTSSFFTAESPATDSNQLHGSENHLLHTNDISGNNQGLDIVTPMTELPDLSMFEAGGIIADIPATQQSWNNICDCGKGSIC